uniref:Putative secreted peptide n=1 Tax=Anopheles braziliensis TaxID=58242 RepID=A0A2M3ZSJ9_9DIPT
MRFVALATTLASVSPVVVRNAEDRILLVASFHRPILNPFRCGTFPAGSIGSVTSSMRFVFPDFFPCTNCHQACSVS